MSFLNLRKKKSEADRALAAEKKLPVREDALPAPVAREAASVDADAIIRPHVTEKAAALGAQGVYVFDVRQFATKKAIQAAVFALYKVRPARVTIAAIPRKQIIVKGKPGVRKGGKKAYVYLKEGDKIEVL